MQTVTQITEERALNSHPLAKAVLRQLGGGRDAIEKAIDAANNGVASAVLIGLYNPSERIAFAKQNRKQIFASLRESADESEEDLLAMVQGFGFLRNYNIDGFTVAAAITGGEADNPEHADRVLEGMAWYAIEEVGFAISDLRAREEVGRAIIQ